MTKTGLVVRIASAVLVGGGSAVGAVVSGQHGSTPGVVSSVAAGVATMFVLWRSWW